jgi:hypothetical protein
MAVIQERPDGGPKTQEQSANRVDEKLMKSGKYEITRDTTFTVTIHSKEKDGRWIIMNGSGRGIDTNTIVFRMWTYDEMIEMRKLATSYDAQKRVHMIDNDALNRLKIQRLMLSWTFDNDNPRLKLWHSNGVLVDEAWGAVVSLQPNIISYIIEEMNKVYEFNG